MKTSKKIELLTLTDEALDKKVKIQGTQYDRKRKVTDKTIAKMKSLYSSKKSVSEIAQKLGLNYMTVKYNVDPAFKAMYNAMRSGAHTGKDHVTVKDRVAYKRGLVAAGKIAVA